MTLQERYDPSMTRSKIAISLPTDQLVRVHREVRAGRADSVSGYIARVLAEQERRVAPGAAARSDRAIWRARPGSWEKPGATFRLRWRGSCGACPFLWRTVRRHKLAGCDRRLRSHRCQGASRRHRDKRSERPEASRSGSPDYPRLDLAREAYRRWRVHQFRLRSKSAPAVYG